MILFLYWLYNFSLSYIISKVSNPINFIDFVSLLIYNFSLSYTINKISNPINFIDFVILLILFVYWLCNFSVFKKRLPADDVNTSKHVGILHCTIQTLLLIYCVFVGLNDQVGCNVGSLLCQTHFVQLCVSEHTSRALCTSCTGYSNTALGTSF